MGRETISDELMLDPRQGRLDAGGTGSSQHRKGDGKTLHHRYFTEQKRL